MSFSVYTPAGLVTMQYTGFLNIFDNLLVPFQKDISQTMPHLYQAALRDLKLKMKIKYLKYLRNCIAQRKMKPGTQNQYAIADG